MRTCYWLLLKPFIGSRSLQGGAPAGLRRCVPASRLPCPGRPSCDHSSLSRSFLQFSPLPSLAEPLKLSSSTPLSQKLPPRLPGWTRLPSVTLIRDSVLLHVSVSETLYRMRLSIASLSTARGANHVIAIQSLLTIFEWIKLYCSLKGLKIINKAK